MNTNNETPIYNEIKDIDITVASDYLPVSSNQVGKYKSGYTPIPLLYALKLEEIFYLPLQKWKPILESNKKNKIIKN